jgi:hypothetical protein
MLSSLICSNQTAMETKKVFVKLRLEPEEWSALQKRAESEYRLDDLEAVVLLRQSLGLAVPKNPREEGEAR